MREWEPACRNSGLVTVAARDPGTENTGRARHFGAVKRGLYMPGTLETAISRCSHLPSSGEACIFVFSLSRTASPLLTEMPVWTGSTLAWRVFGIDL